LPQVTRSSAHRHLPSLRDDPQHLFAGLLDPHLVQEALDREHARWRDGGVYSPAVTLWTFLGQVLDPDGSRRVAVARLIAALVARGEAPCSAETGPYCKARQRLPVGVLERLTRQSARALEAQANDAWLFKGRPVRLIDGTTVSMPDTKKNQQVFPQNPAQKPGLGFPIARLVAIISLATGAVLDVAIGPYLGKQSGETALFRLLWDALVAGDIVLGDRYFSSFFGIAPLIHRGVDVVFRMHQCRKVDFRRGRRVGVLDHVVFWPKPARPGWMDQATYDQFPARVAVREVRIKVEQAGFRVAELVLVTTLLDPVAFSKQDLADLYRRRWDVELDLRSIKVGMGMDVLRCKTPEMVQKEIRAHLLVSNVVRSAMARTARQAALKPRRLSFQGALQAIRAFDAAIRGSRGSRRGELEDARCKAIATHRVGNRPGRCEPRAIKRRPKSQRFLTTTRNAARKALMEAK